MANQLPTLPDVEFVEVNAQETIDEIITGFEELEADRLGNPNFKLADGDPRRLFLLSVAYVIINQRQQINESGKSNLLYYAQDDYLDHLGAFRKVPRIEAQPAVATIQFTLSSVRPTNVGIPQGTRVTADNQLFWRTTEPGTITAGSATVDLTVEAMTAGEDANGLEPGEINRLVDPIPYVASVSNTDTTSSGRDREDDDSYKYRIYQAPSGFSIAGPEEAYIFWALTANSAIVDVSATSPSAGVVNVVPLLEDGEIPSQGILDQVEAVLSPSDIRPLTDNVQVNAPTASNYNIDIDYYIRTEDSPSVAIIQDKVTAAVEDYVLWQKTKLGRDINPDELIARLKEAGVKRVVVREPSYTTTLKSEVAQLGTQTVNYGGLEDG